MCINGGFADQHSSYDPVSGERLGDRLAALRQELTEGESVLAA